MMMVAVFPSSSSKSASFATIDNIDAIQPTIVLTLRRGKPKVSKHTGPGAFNLSSANNFRDSVTFNELKNDTVAGTIFVEVVFKNKLAVETASLPRYSHMHNDQ
jgi:hypothetical protein